jgi:hypothetical protein
MTAFWVCLALLVIYMIYLASRPAKRVTIDVGKQAIEDIERDYYPERIDDFTVRWRGVPHEFPTVRDREDYWTLMDESAAEYRRLVQRFFGAIDPQERSEIKNQVLEEYRAHTSRIDRFWEEIEMKKLQRN